MRRVGPSTNGQEDLEIAVALLLQEQLLDAPVDVVSHIVPRVIGIVLVGIRPRIGQENLASIPDISKGVENMGQFFGWEILWIVVAPINGL